MGKAQKRAEESEMSALLLMRKQPRFHCDWHLQVRLPGFAEFVPVMMTNISMGGMFVEFPTGGLPQSGNVLEFRIDGKKIGDEAGELVGLAIIKWVRPKNLKSQHSGIGVEFTTLPIETARFIKTSIDSVRRKNSPVYE